MPQKQCPLVFLAEAERYHDITVGCGERLEWRRAGMPGAKWPGRLAGDAVAHDCVFEHADLAIEHADVDGLALAAGVAFMQRGEDADGGVEAGHEVAIGSAGAHGRPPGFARDAHDAAHALDDDVERGP